MSFLGIEKEGRGARGRLQGEYLLYYVLRLSLDSFIYLQLEVNRKYDVASHLQQNFLLVPFKLKHTHLAAALLHLSPSSVIVFTNTCANARKTALFLRHLGFQSVGPSGGTRAISLL